MTHPLTYRKTCRTAEQAEKERTILQVLQTSSLRHLIPKPIGAQQNPLTVEMTHIEGTAPVQKDMVTHFLDQLGTALRQLHRFRPCSAFGSFDTDLGIPRRFATFGNFLDTQIEKWTLWHKAQHGSYLYDYAAWLHHELGQLRNYFSDVKPIFCHGDIDTKNLIFRECKLVGLIDWEYAGAYCLAWELRKLPRVLRHDWQWQQLFTAYGASVKTDQQLLTLAIHYLDVADLLGHLRWCIMRSLYSQEAETLQRMYTHFNPKEVN